MYYCPKCDRTISKARIESADRELRDKFGVDRLSSLRCPVCDCEYIDLDKAAAGGDKHVNKSKKEAGAP